MQRTTKLAKDLDVIAKNPIPGILCWQTANFCLEASILGPDKTPYENGVFHVEVQLPERYPFEPPKVRFITKIYHPNIDYSGRICLDLLKLAPNGTWRPPVSLTGVLVSLQQLMKEPNFDDPLMTEIAEEFKMFPELYMKNARDWTMKYAFHVTNDIGLASGQKKKSVSSATTLC